MTASSVLQAQGLTRPKFEVAKARTRVATHAIVVELFGMLGGRGLAQWEYCEGGADEENNGNRRIGGQIIQIEVLVIDIDPVSAFRGCVGGCRRCYGTAVHILSVPIRKV